MSGLCREVIKWLQSLDLTWQVKTPKWDLTNGYLVAEIFSWYYPQEIEMHMYNNGTSLDSKLRNWSLLKNFFKHHKFNIPEEYIEGTIHCKEGAAQLLVERIYESLTNRQIKKQPPAVEEPDFTDRMYQEKLPFHARSTASQAVKNNIKITELMADKNIILGQQKAQTIINGHLLHRRDEREQDPLRFDRKPTLGELAPRSAPAQREDTEISQGGQDTVNYTLGKQNNTAKTNNNMGSISQGSREHTVHFKEVHVKQFDHKAYPFQTTVPGC